MIKVLKDAEFVAVQRRIVELAAEGEVGALKTFMRQRGPDGDLLPGCTVNAATAVTNRTPLMAAAQCGKVSVSGG